MKKYIEVFRMSFKMQIIWRFDVAMTMVATIGRILAAWILWQAIFSSQAMVKGFSLPSMLTYYILGAVLASVDFSHQISGEISALIRSGRFSGHMVTPMNPLGFFGAMTLGESAFHLGFSVLAAMLCTLFFRVNLTITHNMAQISLAVIMILLGLVFMTCYQFLIGILTFKFQEIGFFLHIQWNIIAFATGSLVPLSLLPDTMLAVLRMLPFTHVVYTPVMLLSGQASIAEGLFGLGLIAVWTMAMYFAAERAYTFLRVKYDGVGI